jgi:hypothetical protein
MEKYMKLENAFNDKHKLYEEQLIHIKQTYQDQLIKQHNPFIEDLKYWRTKHEELIKKHEELNTSYNTYLMNCNTSTYIETINQLKAELNVFKNTNTYKGAIGERKIQDILKESFLGYEIKDMSATGSMSDIHLIDKDGNFIAIECKNKSTIITTDVDKSLNDIKVLKDKFTHKFLGYFFVSMRSNNIPKKGDLYYEIIEDRPVIWYATNELQPNELVNLIKLLLLQKYDLKEELDTSILMQKLNCYMTKISENKKYITNLNTNLETMKSNVSILQKNNDWMYQDIFSVVGEDRTPPEESYVCQVCDLTFKRKNELTRHNNKTHKS